MNRESLEERLEVLVAKFSQLQERSRMLDSRASQALSLCALPNIEENWPRTNVIHSSELWVHRRRESTDTEVRDTEDETEEEELGQEEKQQEEVHNSPETDEKTSATRTSATPPGNLLSQDNPLTNSVERHQSQSEPIVLFDAIPQTAVVENLSETKDNAQSYDATPSATQEEVVDPMQKPSSSLMPTAGASAQVNIEQARGSAIEIDWEGRASAALEAGEWKQAVDAKQRKYYFHVKDKKTTWNLAKELQRRHAQVT